MEQIRERIKQWAPWLGMKHLHMKSDGPRESARTARQTIGDVRADRDPNKVDR